MCLTENWLLELARFHLAAKKSHVVFFLLLRGFEYFWAIDIATQIGKRDMFGNALFLEVIILSQ